jgi:hypothetical protein
LLEAFSSARGSKAGPVRMRSVREPLLSKSSAIADRPPRPVLERVLDTLPDDRDLLQARDRRRARRN